MLRGQRPVSQQVGTITFLRTAGSARQGVSKRTPPCWCDPPGCCACSQGPRVGAQPRCPWGGASGDERPAPHISEQFCNQEAKWEPHAGMQLLTSGIFSFIITHIRYFSNI